MNRFLFVEDREIFKPLTRMIQRRGDSADYVLTAHEGLQKVRENAYDIVIIDGSQDREVCLGRTLSEVLAEEYPSITRIGTSSILTADRDPKFCSKYHHVLTGSNLTLDTIYQVAGLSPLKPKS